MQIQKQNLARTLTTFEGGDLIFPLRIGINTSSAYLGNLGTAANIDFTIIGNGVNFAKRLEGSCHPHLIMLGETTKELITPLGSVAKNIEQKFIKIKHHNDLMQAYSLNPFLEEPELFAKAMEAYQISLGRVRKQERMLENHFNAAKINTNYGVLKLIDLTADGFTVIAPGLLPKGTVINMMLDKGGVAKSARTLADIAAEVVWAYEEPDGSLHEIRPLGVNEEELEAVRTALRELLKGEIVIAES